MDTTNKITPADIKDYMQQTVGFLNDADCEVDNPSLEVVSFNWSSYGSPDYEIDGNASLYRVDGEPPENIMFLREDEYNELTDKLDLLQEEYAERTNELDQAKVDLDAVQQRLKRAQLLLTEAMMLINGDDMPAPQNVSMHRDIPFGMRGE